MHQQYKLMMRCELITTNALICVVPHAHQIFDVAICCAVAAPPCQIQVKPLFCQFDV